jgi:hypothetical protein
MAERQLEDEKWFVHHRLERLTSYHAEEIKRRDEEIEFLRQINKTRHEEIMNLLKSR